MMKDGRTDEKDRVVIGRDKIVHHHRQSGVDWARLEQLAVAARAIPRDVRRERLVAEEQQVAGDWIELRMRRHRTLQLAAEVEQADSLERERLELVRRRGLEQREQAIGVSNDVGVGGVLERRHVRRHLARVAKQSAEERASLLHLGLEAVGADVAIAISGAAVAQDEGVDHAVAVEPMVAAERLEVRVGPDAIERAVELARELAFDFEIEGVALFAPRCVVAGQVWVGCVVHKGTSS